MTNKKLYLAVLLISLFLLSTQPVDAKRLLPQISAKTSGNLVNQRSISTRGVRAAVKFRSDRRAIIINFSDLMKARSVSYFLSYTARGTTQGIAGTITPTQDTEMRELLFGTCSNGICRYDTGITNAKFVLTTTLQNGTKVVKSFRLKV